MPLKRTWGDSGENYLHVDPKLSFLAVWKDTKKPHEVLQPLEPEKVARKFESRAMWANALRSFGAAMATTNQTTTTTERGSVSVIGTSGSAIGTYRGSSASTTTSPDVETRRKAEARNAATSAHAQEKAAAVASAALKVHTVFPNGDVFGEVYFSRKKFDVGYFVIKIEDAFYQFGIAPKQK